MPIDSIGRFRSPSPGTLLEAAALPVGTPQNHFPWVEEEGRIPNMKQSKKRTESASDPVPAERISGKGASEAPEPPEPPARPVGRRVRRRGPAAPQPAPDASPAKAVVAQARQLLERLVRSAGFGWRDVDRLIHKNRGFTAHLLSKRESLPLNDLLEILDVIDVKYEDFFAVLFPRYDKPRFKQPIGTGLVELMNEVGVAEAPADSEADSEERARALWGQLDRVTELIDRRVLDLMERALGEAVPPPPRAAVPTVPPPGPAARTRKASKPAAAKR